jgi:hypothetical protein
MADGSEHLVLPDGIAQLTWSTGHRRRMPFRRMTTTYSRPQLAFAGAALAVVAVVITAFALGGSSSHLSNTTASGGAASIVDTAPVPARQSTATASHGGLASSAGGSGGTSAGAAGSAGAAHPRPEPSPPVTQNAPSGTSGTSGGQEDFSAHPASPTVGDSGVAATRVVKTGSLALTVKKGQVGPAITALTAKTTELGGYVSQSRTEDVGGAPTGSLTLRIPVTRFEDAVTAASTLGHETSLSTDAHDVTGKFVDLSARLSALKHTRATYLTILSRARTIGQTLSVQQRVNSVQQQIESLQGQLKVLRNQSADGTLTVDVSEAGASPVAVVHHHRSGWSKAWHNSTGRFNRGLQAIIGGLGPLLLALILLAALYAVGRIVLRGRSTT